MISLSSLPWSDLKHSSSFFFPANARLLPTQAWPTLFARDLQMYEILFVSSRNHIMHHKKKSLKNSQWKAKCLTSTMVCDYSIIWSGWATKEKNSANFVVDPNQKVQHVTWLQYFGENQNFWEENNFLGGNSFC